MADNNPTDAIAQFNVLVDTPYASDPLPVFMLMHNEDRSGGWNGTLRLNPRQESLEDTVQTIMRDGLRPGSTIVVRMVIAGNTEHVGTTVRSWPSIVTSLNTTVSRDAHEPDPLTVVTFRDPLTFLRTRTIWTAYADCSIGEMVGGALSVAAGGDGKPTLDPVLPGMPLLHIEEELRDEIATLAYTVATGEPFGHWFNRVCSRLGVRFEMVGSPDGALTVTLRDGNPTESSLNNDGGLDMYFNPSRGPSATNMILSGAELNSTSTPRGGLLDDAAGGGAQHFGEAGGMEAVWTEADLTIEEALRRTAFRHANNSLAQVGTVFASSQPGMLPGRVVGLGPDPNDDRSYASVFGARRWQVAAVAHLCLQGRYWNKAILEKTGLAWRPAARSEAGAVIVSGIVDDGQAEPGTVVERDRLGRIPVRFPFVREVAESADDGSMDDDMDMPDEPDEPGDDTNGSMRTAMQWPPIVRLAPITPAAGDLHGFVSDHRQGDWCRVSVFNPLYAEIIGFRHRDDRYLSEGVRDATVGIVMREDEGDWRGILFRPEEDLADETEDADS